MTISETDAPAATIAHALPASRPSLRTIGLAEGSGGETNSRYNGYRSPVIEGVLTGTRRVDWNLIHFCTHPVEYEPVVGQYAYHCDGLIHFATHLTPAIRDALVQAGIPTVVIGGRAHGGGLASIDIDNIAAARSATAHLIELGHRRIGMLCGDIPETTEQRVEGCRQAHRNAALAMDDSFIVPCRATGVGAACAPDMLTASPERRPTAVLCFNDAIAIGLLRVAQDLGLNVPRDLSIVGFDDLLEGALSKPALTTIRQPLRQIGEHAVQLLIDIIEGRHNRDAELLLGHELIVRASTGPPASP